MLWLWVPFGSKDSFMLGMTVTGAFLLLCWDWLIGRLGFNELKPLIWCSGFWILKLFSSSRFFLGEWWIEVVRGDLDWSRRFRWILWVRSSPNKGYCLMDESEANLGFATLVTIPVSSSMQICCSILVNCSRTSSWSPARALPRNYCLSGTCDLSLSL